MKVFWHQGNDLGGEVVLSAMPFQWEIHAEKFIEFADPILPISLNRTRIYPFEIDLVFP